MAITSYELRNYSLQRYINNLAERQRRFNMDSSAQMPTCPEGDISDDLARQHNIQRPLDGGVVPLVLASGLDTKTVGTGSATVATKLEDLVTVVRNKSVVIKSGAEELHVDNGGAAVPTQTAGTNHSFGTENPNVDVGQSDSTSGQLIPTPKTLQATT